MLRREGELFEKCPRTKFEGLFSGRCLFGGEMRFNLSLPRVLSLGLFPAFSEITARTGGRDMRLVCAAAGRLLGVALLLILGGSSLQAQTNNGAISGSIIDSSGGAVADAQVQAKSVESQSVYNTVSTSTGAYRFSDLVLGSYNVSVTAPGFKVAEATGVVVQINTISS